MTSMESGVMLDYEYLYSLDNNSLETFKYFLDEKELEVVVDFSRSIDHFIDLTLMNQVEENYLCNKSYMVCKRVQLIVLR